jgi:hypothetical protein
MNPIYVNRHLLCLLHAPGQKDLLRIHAQYTADLVSIAE